MDLKAAFDAPQRIALWASGQYSALVSEHDMSSLGYTRISEYVEVSFAPRDKNEVLQSQLDALTAREKEVRHRFQQALDEISGERANLQSLPFIPAANIDPSTDDDLPS